MKDRRAEFHPGHPSRDEFLEYLKGAYVNILADDLIITAITAVERNAIKIRLATFYERRVLVEQRINDISTDAKAYHGLKKNEWSQWDTIDEKTNKRMAFAAGYLEWG